MFLDSRMKNIINIFKIWFNELAYVVKDQGIFIFVVLLPLGYPLLYSYIYNNEVVREVQVAVVDESDSDMSRRFVRMMDATPDVDIVARCQSMDEAEELIRRQEAYGILRIPKSFAEDIYRGDQTTVGTYSDMCSMLYYKALLLAANNVALEMNRNIKVAKYIPGTTSRQDEITRMPVEYDYVQLYNPQGGFAAFLIPPVLMLIIQQSMLLGIGMSMGRMRERYMGFGIPFKRYYKNPFYIVVGKGLVYFMIYTIMGIYMFTFVTRTFSLTQIGTFGVFLQFLVPYVLACIFLSMVVSFFIYRREDCILLIVFMSVPLLFISGISWPGSAVPDYWRYLSYVFPSSFGLNGYVRISSMGASIHDIAFEYKGLWLQTAVYFLFALLFYRREVLRVLNRRASFRLADRFARK